MMKWFNLDVMKKILVSAAVLGAVAVCYIIARGNIDREYNVVLIPKTIGSTEFWQTFTEGGTMAANEYGVNLEIIGTEDETDEMGQISIIREILERDEYPDAMVISPLSYSDITDVLEEVEESGICLVLADSIVDKEVAESVVATDNVLAGIELGEYASSLIEEGDEILIIGHVEGSSTAIDREQGVRAGLGKKEAGIQEIVFCDSSYIKAKELTHTLVQEYPDVKIIIGLNENAAVGAARALKEIEKQGEILLVGFDSSLEEVKLMEEGVFQGIVIQNPFNMGYLGVEQSIKLIQGKEVEDNIDSGSKLITMKNLYDEENQKLLFPFYTSTE